MKTSSPRKHGTQIDDSVRIVESSSPRKHGMQIEERYLPRVHGIQVDDSAQIVESSSPTIHGLEIDDSAPVEVEVPWPKAHGKHGKRRTQHRESDLIWQS